MKYVFLGSGPVAKMCLQHIICKHEKFFPLAIIGDNECLRIFNGVSNTKKILLGVKKSETAILEILEENQLDFIISVQYPWILSSEVLKLVSGRAFNIHNAKLPEYRGHNSLSYEILNCETEHVSTLHTMDVIVDTGNLIKSCSVNILPNETAYSLWKKSSVSCVSLFDWLVVKENFAIADTIAQPIIGAGKYYKKKQVIVDKKIPIDSDKNLIARYARAFYFPPHEPAYFMNGKMKIYVSPNF